MKLSVTSSCCTGGVRFLEEDQEEEEVAAVTFHCSGGLGDVHGADGGQRKMAQSFGGFLYRESGGAEEEEGS
jgi:hypothetical protein